MRKLGTADLFYILFVFFVVSVQKFSVFFSPPSSVLLPPCWPAAGLIDVECDPVNNWTFLIIVIKATIHCGDGSS